MKRREYLTVTGFEQQKHVNLFQCSLHESYTDDYRYECLRGCNVLEFKIIRFVLIGLANLIIVVSVVFLMHHVISTERRMNDDSAGTSNNESSINATWQGIFYIGAFMFSWA